MGWGEPEAEGPGFGQGRLWDGRAGSWNSRGHVTSWVEGEEKGAQSWDFLGDHRLGTTNRCPGGNSR